MNNTLAFRIYFLCLLALQLCSTSIASEAEFVLVDANRIDLTNGKIVHNSSVWIKGQTIHAVDAIDVPKSVKRISVAGHWLIPGLSEMHAHVPSFKNRAEYAEHVLKLFVLHGVTNIRGMLGEPSHLKLRDKLNQGEVIGPYLVTSGPSLNGSSVRNITQAKATVSEQSAAGYDFLKIHPGMTAKVYEAVVQQAKILNIPWGGHISADVGIIQTLDYQQATIDHLDGFIEELVKRSGKNASKSSFFGANIAYLADFEMISQLVSDVKPFAFAIVNTEALMDNMANRQTDSEIMANPALKLMPKTIVKQWQNRRVKSRSSVTFDQKKADKFLDVRRQLTRELHQQGVPLLLGSDAPQIFNVPGDSTHRELELLVSYGLTPLEALQTGTQNVYQFYQEEHAVGLIKPGARADLLILSDNPLENISHTRQIDSVVIGGKLLNRKFLNELKDELQIASQNK